MKRTLLPSLGLATASIIVLAGCAPTEAAGEVNGGLTVVATTTQVADFTRQVAGDEVTVTQLLKPNTSAHGFDPTPADLLALGEADVLVINGLGLEEWLDGAVQASGFDGLTVDSSRDIDVLETGETPEAEHADEAEEDSHAGETEEEHAEHADGDPHIWTSIRNAERMVATIADGLAEADSGNAAEYEANAEAYIAKLQQLDDWATAQIDSVPVEQRLLVSNHEALGYFTRDYEITYVGAVVPSFDDNAELAASDIEDLVAKIRETGATAVFAEASLSPKSAETIAREAGVLVFTGPDALYADSLGPADSGAATYIAAQAHNITQILTGWGVTAAPLPDELAE